MAATVAGSVTRAASPSTTRSNSRAAMLSVQRGSRARFLPLRVLAPVSNHQPPSDHSVPTAVTCGLPSRLMVASQHVCRLGPPSPGAWPRPSFSGASIRAQSSKGRSYRSARLVAFMSLRQARVPEIIASAAGPGAGVQSGRARDQPRDQPTRRPTAARACCGSPRRPTGSSRGCGCREDWSPGEQLRVLARLAGELGDGRVELTSRGNVQLRGLAADAARPADQRAIGRGAASVAQPRPGAERARLAARRAGPGTDLTGTVRALDARAVRAAPARAGCPGGSCSRSTTGAATWPASAPTSSRRSRRTAPSSTGFASAGGHVGGRAAR